MTSPILPSNPDAPLDRIDSYDFTLPEELIAQHPLSKRDSSRLLVIDKKSGTWEHKTFPDIVDYLNAGDVSVFNSTKVLPAKLQGIRESTGGKWSGLFLGVEADGAWNFIGKTRGKLTAGERIELVGFQDSSNYFLTLQSKSADGWLATPQTDEPAEEVLMRIGAMPLPPYIERGAPEVQDEERYQTVFAKTSGAVAAPTAGLHFTNEILQAFDRKNVVRSEVTLHVGVGTFRPVTAEKLADHVMHHEWAELTAETANAIRTARTSGNRCLAVGTTAVRTVETAAAGGDLKPFVGETNLFIRPPYEFRVVDMLLTNFHLPKSTLLVLVSTLAGRELMLDAYAEAVREKYRFFSYGDAMLII